MEERCQKNMINLINTYCILQREYMILTKQKQKKTFGFWHLLKYMYLRGTN